MIARLLQDEAAPVPEAAGDVAALEAVEEAIDDALDQLADHNYAAGHAHVDAQADDADDQLIDGEQAEAPQINLIPVAPPVVVAAAAPAAPAVDQDLGAAHQALLIGGGPLGFQAFRKPTLFYPRVSQLVSVYVTIAAIRSQ